MVAVELPAELREAVTALATPGVAGASRQLSERYRDPSRRRGAVASTAADVAAYAVTRLPATYAALRAVLAELARQRPAFAPRTQLDLGAGLGAALWAAAVTWPTLAEATAVDAEPAMLRLGAALPSPGTAVSWQRGALPAAVPDTPFDLVTIGYVLNELDETARAETLRRAWAATAGALIVVEPGTPDGCRLTLAARGQLLAAGGTTVAPCPHDARCPLPADDWCHFAVRLARTSAHRRAKDAELAHEDEKFSHAIVAREPGPRAAARILRHPQIRPGHVRLKLCMPQGIEEAVVSKRDGEAYRRARKASWGEDLGDVRGTS
jgi:ribosomal protein RSM22 (predicted rRNA methylase)